MNNLKSKQIFFNTEMVKAILDGRKTQTRRVVRAKILLNNKHIIAFAIDELANELKRKENSRPYRPYRRDFWNKYFKYTYQKNDLLWVRETYHVKGELPAIEKLLKTNLKDKEDYFIYKADLPENEWENYKWKSPYSMRKNACRLWLKVVDVSVERLQDIKEEDAIKEGVQVVGSTDLVKKVYKIYLKKEEKEFGYAYEARNSFSTLWDSIYGDTDYNWSNNPWVWVIEFERI